MTCAAGTLPRQPARAARRAPVGFGPALAAALLALHPAGAGATGPEAGLEAGAGADPAALAALAGARAALRAAERARAAAAEALRPEQQDAFAALAALDRIGRAPPLALLAHPGGPAQAARAAMALGAAAPALAARAAETRARLDRLAAAGETARTAAARLAAIGAPAPAIEAPPGAPAPRPRPASVENGSAPDPREDAMAATARLLALVRALDPPHEPDPAPPPEAARWPAPAPGALLARFDPDAGARGATLGVPAYAAVRAPMVASVRYAGPAGGAAAQGGGVTVVLEPEAGVLVALRGLASAAVAAGDTLRPGALIGATGGPGPASNEFLIDASSSKGTIQIRPLYIEVRRAGVAADPAEWFGFDEERTTR